MLTQIHSAKSRADMAAVDAVGPLRSAFRSLVRLVAAATMIFTIQVALAQAANDCNDVVTAATTAAKNETDALDAREKLTNQAVENAKSCIDRLLQIIRNMSPTWPSIQSISIQMIVDYLSNKICSVATAQVQNTLGPISASVNGQVNGAVGRVNGAVGGVSGGVVGSGGVGPVVSVASPAAAPAAQAQGQSIWAKVGCAFGSGAGC